MSFNQGLLLQIVETNSGGVLLYMSIQKIFLKSYRIGIQLKYLYYIIVVYYSKGNNKTLNWMSLQ